MEGEGSRTPVATAASTGRRRRRPSGRPAHEASACNHPRPSSVRQPLQAPRSHRGRVLSTERGGTAQERRGSPGGRDATGRSGGAGDPSRAIRWTISRCSCVRRSEGRDASTSELLTDLVERSCRGRADDLHLHDIRHYANLIAASAGASTKELMSRLGHASPAAPLRYQHATVERGPGHRGSHGGAHRRASTVGRGSAARAPRKLTCVTVGVTASRPEGPRHSAIALNRDMSRAGDGNRTRIASLEGWNSDH